MAERILADTGSFTVGKFELKYQIEGTGSPVIVIGSAIYYSRTLFDQELLQCLVPTLDNTQ